MSFKLGQWCWLLVIFSQDLLADNDLWQYGAMVDLSYTQALQGESVQNWRNKLTTNRLNQFAPNMGMFYLRKLNSEDSRWGLELGAQAGFDTDGQVPSEQRLAGYSILRYLSRANLSYLAPIGNGLTITAGLMNSFIGFESMFAKDNNHYTRTWMADYSPYYLLGVGAQYPLNQQLTVGLYLLSDYDYLAYRNDQPKYGGQLQWTINSQWKLSQNLFAGAEQKHTDSQFWRYLSDTILQWSQDDLSLTLAQDVGTERIDNPERRQVFWLASVLSGRWHIDGPWSVALRPELYWDADGRMTGSQQLIKAATATVEYKLPVNSLSMVFRGEYRIDDSMGKQGGFYRSQAAQGELVANQQLLLFSWLLSFDR